MNDLGTPTTAELSPLSRDHDYVRRNPAPAYWALSPFLLHQHTDASCSLATAVMLLNGARTIQGIGRMGAFVSELNLLERIADPHWQKEVTPPEGNGLSLVELAGKLAKLLPLYGLDRWQVTHRVVEGMDAVDDFRAALAAMERDGDRLLAGNYHLATTYGDDWDVGHFSPLGAYDAATDRVLLLDVWKADYEPCWLPVERLLRGMIPVSPVSGTARGYLVLRRG